MTWTLFFLVLVLISELQSNLVCCMKSLFIPCACPTCGKHTANNSGLILCLQQRCLSHLLKRLLYCRRRQKIDVLKAFWKQDRKQQEKKGGKFAQKSLLRSWHRENEKHISWGSWDLRRTRCEHTNLSKRQGRKWCISCKEHKNKQEVTLRLEREESKSNRDHNK